MRPVRSESSQVGLEVPGRGTFRIGVGETQEAQTLTSHLPGTYNEKRLVLAVLQCIEASGFL